MGVAVETPRIGDPALPSDATLNRIELGLYAVDVLVAPLCDLSEGPDASQGSRFASTGPMP